MSVTVNHYSLCNNPEERSARLLCVSSLKSHKDVNIFFLECSRICILLYSIYQRYTYSFKNVGASFLYIISGGYLPVGTQVLSFIYMHLT